MVEERINVCGTWYNAQSADLQARGSIRSAAACQLSCCKHGVRQTGFQPVGMESHQKSDTIAIFFGSPSPIFNVTFRDLSFAPIFKLIGALNEGLPKTETKTTIFMTGKS